MAKPGVNLEFDMTDGYAALGFIQGIATTVNTDRYIGTVVNYTHAQLARAFDEHMDVVSRTNPSAYSHVYEWRMIGLPQGRLWKHKISGGGAIAGIGRVREATFEWRASTQPILTPEERYNDDNDPISKIDPAIIAKLKKRTYFFYNKASMMEYGLRATVSPKNAKFLFVPTSNPSLSGPKGFYLAQSTNQNFAYKNPQDSSGGSGTVGRFTAAWVEWWTTVAPRMWNSEISKTVEHDLGKSEIEMSRATHGHKRNKVIGIGVFNDEYAAFESGKNLASAYVYGKAASYARAAAIVEREGVFG